MRIVIILGGWSLFGIFMVLQAYVEDYQSGREFHVLRVFVREMTYAYLWAALTPIVLALVRRYRFERSRLVRLVPVHIMASLLIAVIHKACFLVSFGGYLALAESAQFIWTAQFHNLWYFLDYGVLLYWMILALNYAFEYYHQYREKETEAARLEAQLAQAQLAALKMQLHPHFLFNTLNAISVLIQRNPDMARQMLGQLSDLLRITLERSGEQLVSLKTELDFLDRYLQIEQIRFGERLTVRTLIDRDALEAEVPNMILQPLVENAIRHGVSDQRGQAVITIEARKVDGTLHLEVRDNGKGFSRDGSSHDGIGLSNTRARLSQLFGRDHRLEFLDAPEGGAVAAFDIPFRGHADI